MNEITDTQKLTGVPETLLVALYLRSVESQRAGGIIRDEKAVEMIQRIEYDFARFNKCPGVELSGPAQGSLAIHALVCIHPTAKAANDEQDRASEV